MSFKAWSTVITIVSAVTVKSPANPAAPTPGGFGRKVIQVAQDRAPERIGQQPSQQVLFERLAQVPELRKTR